MNVMLRLAPGVIALPTAAAAGPNILWLTAKDMSPNLGCYGDTQAYTPRLDAFAREAVRFTRAFSTAPVCSPSRSCLSAHFFEHGAGAKPGHSTMQVRLAPAREAEAKGGVISMFIRLSLEAAFTP